jgi:hypothetical protein
MKQTLKLFLFLSVPILLWGCPYDSPYGIDPTPREYIDESLLGSWATLVSKPAKEQVYKEDAVEVIFSKNNDFEYDIAITGYINELKPYHVITNDSIKGTAYISTVGDKEFLNSFIKGKMYIAEMKKENNNLSIICLAEHFTNKYIKNSKELRKAIELHYRLKPIPTYDEYFGLKNLQKVN